MNRTRHVSEIMSRELVFLRPDDSLKRARELLSRAHVHHLPVVDDGNRLVGIISDRDVSSQLSPFVDTPSERDQDRWSLRRRVDSVMSADPVTIEDTDSVRHAARLMLAEGVSCLPIVDPAGVLVGLVTSNDLLHVLAAD
ncbi:MAG: CBS domain-containing protein [Leptospiraceae bacterium]|nr:CBS domain-containing protein [Leptospiraceae bacterium]